MVIAGKPIREIEHDTREEPGFGNAKQESHNSKTRRASDHRRQASEYAPCDQDASDPQPCADLFHGDVAGHLEQEISPIESADGKTERRGRHVEIPAHG
jgi:hypothetical protein